MIGLPAGPVRTGTWSDTAWPAAGLAWLTVAAAARASAVRASSGREGLSSTSKSMGALN
jgi:hypothetical protein